MEDMEVPVALLAAGAHTLGPEELSSARKLCLLLRSEPSLLCLPELSFFRDFLQTFPKSVAYSTESTASVASSECAGQLAEEQGLPNEEVVSERGCEEVAESALDDAAAGLPEPALVEEAAASTTYMVPGDAVPGATSSGDDVIVSDVVVPGKVNRDAKRRQQKAASAREYRKREKFEQCSVEMTICALREELAALTGVTVVPADTALSLSSTPFDPATIDLQPSMEPSKGSSAPRAVRKAISARKSRLLKKMRDAALQVSPPPPPPPPIRARC